MKLKAVCMWKTDLYRVEMCQKAIGGQASIGRSCSSGKTRGLGGGRASVEMKWRCFLVFSKEMFPSHSLIRNPMK